MIRRNTFEPRTARHLAPRRKGHPTAPTPPVAANVAPLWPVGGQPTWDIFEPDSEVWVDSWLSVGDLKYNAKMEKAA